MRYVTPYEPALRRWPRSAGPTAAVSSAWPQPGKGRSPASSTSPTYRDPPDFPARILAGSTDPHVLVHPNGRFVLDNDLWLRDEGGTFSEEVRRHFPEHRRRLVTRATLGAQPEAAWETTPTTVLIRTRQHVVPGRSQVGRRASKRCSGDRHRPLHDLPAPAPCRQASP
jgi:hypothetical protein